MVSVVLIYILLNFVYNNSVSFVCMNLLVMIILYDMVYATESRIAQTGNFASLGAYILHRRDG